MQNHTARWFIVGIVAVTAVLLIISHWTHVSGYWPYLVILACPLMHIFMHNNHDHTNK